MRKKTVTLKKNIHSPPKYSSIFLFSYIFLFCESYLTPKDIYVIHLNPTLLNTTSKDFEQKSHTPVRNIYDFGGG